MTGGMEGGNDDEVEASEDGPYSSSVTVSSDSAGQGHEGKVKRAREAPNGTQERFLGKIVTRKRCRGPIVTGTMTTLTFVAAPWTMMVMKAKMSHPSQNKECLGIRILPQAPRWCSISEKV